MKKLITETLLMLLLGACRKPPEIISYHVDLAVKKTAQNNVILSIKAEGAYKIIVCKNGDHCAERNGEINEIEFAGLEPNSIYYFQATAFFPSGIKETSNLVEVKTLIMATTLKAENVTLHTATILGEIFSEENTEYFFQYGNGNLNQQTEVTTGKGLVTSQLNNLEWGKDYLFRIVLRIGNENYFSETKEFKTLGNKAELSDLQIICPDTTSIRIIFKFKGNLLPSTLTLYYSTPTGPVTMVNSCPETDTVWDNKIFEFPIKPMLVYQFSLTAQNDLGFTKIDTTTKSPAFMHDDFAYNWVQIGEQIWTVENFRGKHYQNGDLIPYIRENADWASTNTGAMCYYDNDEYNFNIYGALYNFFVVTDEREVAPHGWRVPTGDDFLQLYHYMTHRFNGGSFKTTGFDYWLPPNTSATNTSGFSARGSGWRAPANKNGVFDELKMVAVWHINDNFGPYYSECFVVFHNQHYLLFGYNPNEEGRSIRFIKE